MQVARRMGGQPARRSRSSGIQVDRRGRRFLELLVGELANRAGADQPPGAEAEPHHDERDDEPRETRGIAGVLHGQ
jgi:hypothetical protein